MLYKFISIDWLILHKMSQSDQYVHHVYTVFQNNEHPFYFCYNFGSRDQILVIFGILIAKEICNRTLLPGLKEIAGTLR